MMDEFDHLLASTMGDSSKAFLAAAQYDRFALFRDPQLDPIPLSAPPAAIRGEEVVRWTIRPALFHEVLESVTACKDASRWPVQRVAEQVLGHTSSGIGIVLTPEDVRALPVNVGKALVSGVKFLGDAPAIGAPSVEGEGDGIAAPLCVRLGTPVEGIDALRFHVNTLWELENIGVRGVSVVEDLRALMDLSHDPDVFDSLVPADGWFLMQKVLTPLVTTAGKILHAVRSYEFAMNVQFDPDTPLKVIRSKQKDYGELFDKKNKAMEKATQSSRGKRRR